MPEADAPLILIGSANDGRTAGTGTHVAIAAEGRRLLGEELSDRLSRAGGRAVTPAPAELADGERFHWGRWFSDAARAALGTQPGDEAGGRFGYAGGSALALLDDDGLAELLGPNTNEVIANNRFSADAFVLAGDHDTALTALAECRTDNAAPRALNDAGFAWRDLGQRDWARFDVDTTLDLALLRLARRLPNMRRIDAGVATFLESAQLPHGGGLEVPRLEDVGEVIRSRSAELVVAGRIPASTWSELETEAACRVRCLIEERGMRSAAGDAAQPPRSILAALMARSSPAELIADLAGLGDAVVLDTRVLMASLAGSSDPSAWPTAEDRFASDFGDHARVETTWLRELTEAAADAPVPFLFGAHALVSDGLRLIVASAWMGH